MNASISAATPCIRVLKAGIEENDTISPNMTSVDVKHVKYVWINPAHTSLDPLGHQVDFLVERLKHDDDWNQANILLPLHNPKIDYKAIQLGEINHH